MMYNDKMISRMKMRPIKKLQQLNNLKTSWTRAGGLLLTKVFQEFLKTQVSQLLDF